MQRTPHVERRPITGPLPRALHRRQGLASAVVSKRMQVSRDLAIAVGDLLVTDIIQRHRLRQGKRVLVTPLAVQRLRNGSRIVLAAIIPQSRQPHRIAFSSHDRADDGHTGHASDIAADVLQLDIHLRQGFLYMLDMVTGITQEHGALPQITPQDTYLGLWAERAGQQAEGMQPF